MKKLMLAICCLGVFAAIAAHEAIIRRASESAKENREGITP